MQRNEGGRGGKREKGQACACLPVLCAKGLVEAVDPRLVHFASSPGGHGSLAFLFSCSWQLFCYGVIDFLVLLFPLRVWESSHQRLRPGGLASACVWAWCVCM